MKITFVYPDFYPKKLNWQGSFYIGVALLSAALKQEGRKTSLIHVTRPMEKHDFIKRIQSEDPDLIGFSSTSHTFPFIEEMASWLIETKIKIPTIYGGTHPTICPEESIGIDGIDMICRGEGEAALVELCQRMENKEDVRHIPNLWVKNDGRITRNQLRPLLKNLDKLPFPDRGIFDYQNLLDEREGIAVFLASRGCPYNCAYCCNHILRKVHGSKGKVVRFIGVDRLIAEIKDVLEHYPFINCLNFHDDIFFLKRKWSEEFAEKYPREINLPFICNARADVTDDALVELLKKAGCTHVKLGLESGNEEIRIKVLNRPMTNGQIKKAFAMCKKSGLKTLSFNMVGIPYETPSKILDTIKLNASISVDYTQVTIYQPYKGTKLGKLCQEKHYIEDRDLGPSFFSSTVLKLNTISSSQIRMFRSYFRVLVLCYQLFQKLSPAISDILTKFLDKILSFNLTSKVLNLIYVPLYYFYRRLMVSRFKAEIPTSKVDILPPAKRPSVRVD